MAECVAALPEDHWKPYREEADAIREWAEVNYLPSDGIWKKDTVSPRRYLAIRIRSRQGSPLRDGNRVRHFCIVTNRSDPEGGCGLDLIRWHRQKAGTIEHAHDVLMNELAGAALPSQKFGANAAWLRLNVILYNLLPAYKRVGRPEELHTARPKRLQFLLLNTVGKVVRHARETLLRCAKAHRSSPRWTTANPLRPQAPCPSRGLRGPARWYQTGCGRVAPAASSNYGGDALETEPVSSDIEALGLDDLILETRGLSREFRGFMAVQGLDLKIRRGTIHALIGPNGAGKTTVFNLLTKFLEPSTGKIIYDGQDITAARPAEIARRGMVRSFQISAVFPHVTVRDNVRVALQQKMGNSFHFWRSERILDNLTPRAEALLEAVGLSGFEDATAAELPYGRKRALEIATTLALDPVMLLLDEPMAGLGQEDIVRISALIRKVATDRTVLMVEHNLSVVADLSDMITVLTRGRILAEGDYPTVSGNPEVVEAYMGTGHA